MKNNKFKAWVKKQFDRDELSDIINYGCDGGFNGITYYTETTALYNKFTDEIWDMLGEDAEDQGMTIPELISSFNGAKDVCSGVGHNNLLVWYAVERTAREFMPDA